MTATNNGEDPAQRARTPWTVTFDAADDRDRRAVHRALAELGPRVLNTVYEVGARPAELDAVLTRLGTHLRRGDHLLAVPRCDRCRTTVRGGTAEPDAPFGWISG